MSLVSTIALFSLPLGLLCWIGLRDRRILRARRRNLLDDCARLFDRYALTYGGDDFPVLSGRSGARNVDVRLISDTMTIRRLPQLWLQVTVLQRLPGVTALAILVRPSGYEFYSLTSGLDHVIETPATFPRELIIRAKDRKMAGFLPKMAPTLARILSDERVKEVAITSNGLRIIRQASEGRRGDYLLLRQAVFDDASVSAADLEQVFGDIDALSESIVRTEKETAST